MAKKPARKPTKRIPVLATKISAVNLAAAVTRAALPTAAEKKKLNQLDAAYAARIFAQIKDALDGLDQRPDQRESELGVPGRSNALRDRLLAQANGKLAIGGLIGDLLRNSDAVAAPNAGPSEQGAARDDASAFSPGGSVADWMAGAASSATVTKDPTTGIVEKTTTWDNDNGTTTTRHTAYNPQEGVHTSTSTTREGRQERIRIQIIDHPDGSSEGSTRMTDAREVWQHTWSRDTQGRMGVDLFQTFNRRGQLTHEWDRAARPPWRDVRMPNEDQVSDLARRLAARFSHGASGKKPEVNRVNPGDPDDSGPRAERINPGQRIVVNPAPDAAGKGRRVSPARARAWEAELRRRIGGKVNPGGGGTGGQS